MNIAILLPYGKVYENDKYFDVSTCKIGQNLLLPGIYLKKELEKSGHEYHTVDVYDSLDDVDVLVVQDLNGSSILTVQTFSDLIKYILKMKWKNDYLYKFKQLQKEKKEKKVILVMQEPKTVFPYSYNSKNHKLFDRILTWDSDLVDKQKIFRFYYPQVKPNTVKTISFYEKKFLTTICGNKSSNNRLELYSERLKIIKYCEQNNVQFDLYGFGWNSNERSSYRGEIDNKLETMSKYKFSICFENMKSNSGYITEKIFDSFFSGCVPVYYGAADITSYVPNNCFIDYRDFKDINELISYLQKITVVEYENYINNIQSYLNGDLFEELFSLDAYVKRMSNYLLRWID